SFAPIPRSDDRFARQDRYGPPPEFPLASPCPGIVHHLSGPIARALAPPPRQSGRDGPVVRPAAERGGPTYAPRARPPARGRGTGRWGAPRRGAGIPPGHGVRRPSPSLRRGVFRAPRLARALDSLVRVSRRVGWVAASPQTPSAVSWAESRPGGAARARTHCGQSGAVDSRVGDGGPRPSPEGKSRRGGTMSAAPENGEVGTMGCCKALRRSGEPPSPQSPS